MWCNDGHMGYNGHMGWGWMGLWWILIAVLICLVAWFVMSVARKNGARSEREPEPPEQAVKRRYANGEIDRETYQRMLEDLRK